MAGKARNPLKLTLIGDLVRGGGPDDDGREESEGSRAGRGKTANQGALR